MLNNRPTAQATYGEMEQWNVAKVTDMSWLFQDVDFKEDISAGNKSQVTKMSGMFYDGGAFASQVTDMSASHV